MSDELAALTARLQLLEDLEAIRSSWLDYCNRLDLEDFDALGDVFCEDASLEVDGLAASLDGRYEGRESIVGFYRMTETAPDGSSGLMTGHLSTNMQIDLDGDEATTLAYFFEIVDNNLVLIGTYQHRVRREPDRWRFASLRISVRFRARLEADRFAGQTLKEIVARPV
ncbi:MAG: nuclear transport factor 2 family protein [Acidimicrobiia bacterium]|nr:nuclear transport factor 2 family protein [Acidimicrobiia bacterium]